MKLKPVNEIELRVKGRNNLFAILTEFAESEHKCVEIEDHKYTSVNNCQTSFIAAIKRYRFLNIKCVVRGERVFLVKQM